MKSLTIAALAFAVFAAWGGPVTAASIDYTLSIPLADISSDGLAPTGLLSGTLSYDDDTAWGIGTFSLVDADETMSDEFSGSAFLLHLGGDATGVLFDGYASNGAELYFNIVASLGMNAIVSSPVNYCTTGCAMFRSLGATMTPADLPPASLPGEITSPGPVVSPVPLPPAASLFCGALLALGGLGAGRRHVARLQPVKRARLRRRPVSSDSARTDR